MRITDGAQADIACLRQQDGAEASTRAGTSRRATTSLDHRVGEGYPGIDFQQQFREIDDRERRCDVLPQCREALGLRHAGEPWDRGSRAATMLDQARTAWSIQHRVGTPVCAQQVLA